MRRNILNWLEHRTGLETALKKFLYEDIPGSAGWPQVFGSLALFLFLTQAFTGILLAFNLAAGVPWWIPVIGGVFAIAVGKMTFGGLGYNPLNPALLARVFLLLSWPVEMTTT